MDDVNQTLAATFTEEQLGKLELFYEWLVEWNEKVNLTAITDHHEVFIKHFLDSVLVAESDEWRRIHQNAGRVVDIGTGAGFPGIPLAICYPKISFTLCDALQKRLKFLEHVISNLGLTNVQLVHGRAEDLGQDKQYRGQFDGVVSRAVARLSILSELMCPFARVGGISFAYKGPQVEDELQDAKRAFKMLGAKVRRVMDFSLPADSGSRHIVVIEQTAISPKQYPRKAGVPQKKPL